MARQIRFLQSLLCLCQDEQDRLEHRQHDTEHRLEVAEGAARQYAQELQELTGEHRARLQAACLL